MTAHSIEARRNAYRTETLIDLWSRIGVALDLVGEDENFEMPMRAIEGTTVHYVWKIVVEESVDERSPDDDCRVKYYFACSRQETPRRVVPCSSDATCLTCRAQGKPLNRAWWLARPPATPRVLDFTDVA